MTGYRVIGQSRIGAATLIDEGVVIGYPAKDSLLANRDFSRSRGAVIGAACILRSGTVVYEDAVLGDNIQTAHNVIIREGVKIGDGCVIGNNSEVQIGAKLGQNVRLQSLVMISENSLLGNNIFISPGVIFTGGRFMTGAMEAAGKLTFAEAKAIEGCYWEGPSVVVEDEVRIGANAVILAGTRLGRGCVIAAGAVISQDVPPGYLAAGNPARLLKQMGAGKTASRGSQQGA